MRDTIQNAFGFYSIVGFLLICSALVLHGMKSYIEGISIGIVVVPMLMEGIAFTKINLVKWFRKILLVLGENSMNIWFLHCIFFSIATRELFQPIAYMIKNPIFVVFWILLLCTIVSIPVGKIQRQFMKILKI